MRISVNMLRTLYKASLQSKMHRNVAALKELFKCNSHFQQTKFKAEQKLQHKKQAKGKTNLNVSTQKTIRIEVKTKHTWVCCYGGCRQRKKTRYFEISSST